MCNNAQKSLFFLLCKLPLASSQISKNTVCMWGGNNQNCKWSGCGLRIPVWESLDFPLWFPIYRQIQSGDICQACMVKHFSIIPNSWCTFGLSMPNLNWADLFRLFDQAVSKRTGIEEVGIPGIHLGWTGIVCVLKKCVTVPFKTPHHFQAQGTVRALKNSRHI